MRTTIRWVLGVLSLLGWVAGTHGQPTLLDLSFNAASGANDDVFAVARDASGGFVVGGQFTTFEGITLGRLARINPTGSMDTTFFRGPGANGNVYAVAIQADGKILIGGSFTQVHGMTRSYLARLDSDGNVDTTFAATPINNELRAIVVEPDGRILIAGRFTSVDGQERNRVARLLSTGALDPAFQPGTGANDNVRTLVRLANGGILIGGQFTAYNGTGRVRLAKLLGNGLIDASFDPGLGANGQVRAIATNAVGEIYVGGDFSTFNGAARPGVARLSPNGTLDAGFNPAHPDGSAVRAIAVEPGGKVWLGGAFSIPGAALRLNLTRLWPDGTPDTFFQPFPLVSDEIFSIVFDGPDQIVIGGDFRTVDNRARSRVARLNPRSTAVAHRFPPFITESPENGGAVTVTVERYGSIVTASSVELRTHDGTALAGQDFVSSSLLVTFAPLETSKTVQIPLIDDAAPEGNEWFFADLVDPPGAPDDPLNPSHRIVILDNEYQAMIDDTFVPDSINGAVLTTAPQPDGTVLIGGEFTYFGGCLENSITRLLPNGTVDCDFTAHSTGADGPVLTISVQPDGRIVAGGLFTYFNSQVASHLVRLQPNGFLDPAFPLVPNVNAGVLATAIQPDGRILVGGMFTAHGAVTQPFLLRLQSDGSLDTSFRPSLNGYVRAIQLTSGNRLFIGGDFTLVNGTGRSRLARLNANGSLDATYMTGPGPDGSVMALAEQSDGRLVIAGEFAWVDNQPRERIARMTLSGGVDGTFTAGSLGSAPRVNTVAIQQDGKIVFGGLFGTVGGQSQPYLARVLDSGILDTGFPSAGANGPIHSVRVLPDQRLLVAGNFTELASANRRYVARLNPEPTLARIEFVSDATNAFESAGLLRLAVRRVGSSAREVSVTYSTVAGTATEGSDFQPVSGTLTFAPLETLKSIPVALVNDGLPEPAESFQVRLDNPAGAVLGTAAEATITVRDNDAGLGFSVPSIQLREGVPAATLTVERRSDGASPVTVNYTTQNGTAVAGGDFGFTSGTLTFQSGEFEKTITIPLQNNPEFEGRESFTVRLSQPSPNVVLGTNAEAVVYIEDQDSSFHFGIINGATEGDVPALCYVARSGFLTQTATIRLRTDGGTATAGLDYVPIDRTLTFRPGEFMQEFYVTNLNDGLFEGSEYIRLTLSEPTGLAIVESADDTFTEIRDNDNGIEFIAPVFYVNEFSATAQSVVRRGDDGPGPVTVRYAIFAESAIAGIDFLPHSGVLTLPAGETNAIIAIPIVRDRLLEPREAFRVELYATSPSAALGPQTVARVVILDDERSGSVDVTFNANPADFTQWGFNGSITVSPGSRGSVFVGAQLGLAQLDRAGRNDTNFAPNPFVNFFTPITLQQPDGRVLVGGSSSNDFMGAGSSTLRLLQTNGAVDPSFSFPINQGRTAAIALQNDGRIVLGGDFTGTTNGVASLLRVLPSGALDPTFRIARFSHFEASFIGPSTVEAVTVQPDGNILAAGRFSSVDTLPRELIVRFLPNGAVDPAFRGPAVLPDIGSIPEFPQEISAATSLALQPDGRIFIGGSFTNLAGIPASNLARLHSDGRLDASFSSPFAGNQVVRAIALQPDGRLIVAVSPRYDASVDSFVCRLLPNGAFDPEFEITKPNGRISDLTLVPGGNIVIGGIFDSIDGIPRALIARLRGDGLVFRAAPAGGAATALELFNTVPGGTTVLESSTDLIQWRPWHTNVADSASQRWIEPNDSARRFYRATHREP